MSPTKKIFILYGFVWFVLLAFIFTVTQDRLPGTKLFKGLIYGHFYDILTFILNFEPLS